MIGRPSVLVGAFAGVVLCVGVPRAERHAPQDPSPPQVRAILTAVDQQGRYVTRLAAGNLTVSEDGIPQDGVSLVPVGDQPVELTLLIDASNSQEEHLLRVQETAIEIARRLRPVDLAEVVSFNARLRTDVVLTNDITALESGIRRIRRSGATALHNAVYISLRERERRIAKAGAAAPRHVVVLLSDGVDTSSLLPRTEIETAIRRTDSTIYSIAPDAQDARGGHGVLRAVARATGGGALIPSTELEPALVAERFWEDIRHHQLLRYTSNNVRRDGRFRRIDVAAPGITIRLREGYFAPRQR